MAPVFLSYRRSDSDAAVGRLADELTRRFGASAVFRDVDSIRAGEDFGAVLRRAIEESEVVLVAIGKQWLNARSSQGRRRLDDADDYVRKEIEQALANGKHVIPILVDGATMPAASALPASIQALAGLQAQEVRSGADFQRDIERLITALENNTQALRESREQLSTAMPMAVAAVAAICGIGLLWVMLANAPMLVRLGLTGNVWYVLLLLLGLSAAIVLFGLFKSYARYSGTALKGTLQLGGPAVLMLVIVVLGHSLVPPPRQRFDLTVFLHGAAGRQAVVLRNEGRLSLDLGADRRMEAVGDKGEVRFVGIPTDLRDERVGVSLQAAKYELADAGLQLSLSQDVFYVEIRPKSLPLVGQVLDAAGRPLQQARVSIAGSFEMTDVDGRFALKLPADLAESERTLTISAAGHETWRAQAVPGGSPLQARLELLGSKN